MELCKHVWNCAKTCSLMGPPAPLDRWDPNWGVAKKQRPRQAGTDLALASIMPAWHTSKKHAKADWHGSCMPSKKHANVAQRILLSHNLNKPLAVIIN